jgi:hypothetical protein
MRDRLMSFENDSDDSLCWDDLGQGLFETYKADCMTKCAVRGAECHRWWAGTGFRKALLTWVAPHEGTSLCNCPLSQGATPRWQTCVTI